MKTLIGLGAALAAAALVSGCGKMGELQRPGPLNGDAGAQEPSRPVDTVDPRDRSTDPRPPRTAPIPSSGSDPFSQPPQGSLPNPYANPQ